MDKKKVSVIIPTFKRSKFLCRAIDSVLNQSYNNIEIIVVDDNGDGSQFRIDNENRLKKYKDNILFLKHEKNLNGAAARNTGILKATGEYITFLDDDDIFMPYRIEKMVNALEENVDFDGCYSEVGFAYYGNLYDVLSTSGSGNFQLDVLKMKNVIGTGSNLFFRKSVMDKIGLFDTNFLRNQDIEYLIRFFEYGKIYELKEMLVIKCKEDEFNFSSNVELMFKVKELFFDKFKKVIKKYPNDIDDIYICNYYPMYINSYKSSKFYPLIDTIYHILDSHGYKETKSNQIKTLIYKLLGEKILARLFKYKMKFKVFINSRKYSKISDLVDFGGNKYE